MFCTVHQQSRCLSAGQAQLVVLHLGDVMAGIGNRVVFSTPSISRSVQGMDFDAGAGRDSTWRRATAAAAAGDDVGDDDARGGGVGGGMEAQVVPLELYDSARAKIDANLRWLFAKAYGTGKASSVFSLSLCCHFDSCVCSCVCFVAVKTH